MRDIKDVVLSWYNEDGDDEEVFYCEEFLEEICSKEDHDYKYVTCSTVYKDKSTGKFYKAWVKRVDDGYWGENARVDEGCYEVVPKEITTTVYEVVK